MITLLACSVSGSDHAEMPSSCLGNEIQGSPGIYSLLSALPLAVFRHLQDAQRAPPQVPFSSCASLPFPEDACHLPPVPPLVTSRQLAPRPLLSSVLAEADGEEGMAVHSYLWQWPWWQVQLSLPGTQPGLPPGQRQWALSSWSWHCCPGWHRLGVHKGTSQNGPVSVGGRERSLRGKKAPVRPESQRSPLVLLSFLGLCCPCPGPSPALGLLQLRAAISCSVSCLAFRGDLLCPQGHFV